MAGRSQGHVVRVSDLDFLRIILFSGPWPDFGTRRGKF